MRQVLGAEPENSPELDKDVLPPPSLLPKTFYPVTLISCPPPPPHMQKIEVRANKGLSFGCNIVLCRMELQFSTSLTAHTVEAPSIVFYTKNNNLKFTTMLQIGGALWL